MTAIDPHVVSLFGSKFCLVATADRYVSYRSHEIPYDQIYPILDFVLWTVQNWPSAARRPGCRVEFPDDAAVVYGAHDERILVCNSAAYNLRRGGTAYVLCIQLIASDYNVCR